MLLLEGIQFLSDRFLPVAMSKASHMRFCLSLENIHAIYCSSYYRFSAIIVFFLCLCCQVLFLVAVISLSLFFLMLSFNLNIDEFTLFSMLANHLPSFLKTYNLYRFPDVKIYLSSLVFLFSGLFIEVLPSSILRMVPSIL